MSSSETNFETRHSIIISNVREFLITLRSTIRKWEESEKIDFNSEIQNLGLHNVDYLASQICNVKLSKINQATRELKIETEKKQALLLSRTIKLENRLKRTQENFKVIIKWLQLKFSNTNSSVTIPKSLLPPDSQDESPSLNVSAIKNETPLPKPNKTNKSSAIPSKPNSPPVIIGSNLLTLPIQGKNLITYINPTAQVSNKPQIPPKSELKITSVSSGNGNSYKISNPTSSVVKNEEKKSETKVDSIELSTSESMPLSPCQNENDVIIESESSSNFILPTNIPIILNNEKNVVNEGNQVRELDLKSYLTAYVQNMNAPIINSNLNFEVPRPTTTTFILNPTPLAHPLGPQLVTTTTQIFDDRKPDIEVYGPLPPEIKLIDGKKMYASEYEIQTFYKMRKCRLRPMLKCVACGRDFNLYSVNALIKRGKVQAKSPYEVVINHIKGHHMKCFSCSTCNRSFPNESSLQSHNEKNHLPPCEICGNPFFKSMRGQRRHLWTHKSAEEREELMKGGELEPLISTTHLRHRKLIEENNGVHPFQCAICWIRLLSKESLARHTGAKHPAGKRKKLLCSDCGMSFGSQAGYTLHMRKKHNPEKLHLFICKFCDKRYYTKITLEDHLRSHTGERPFECSGCSRTFMTKNARKTHEKGCKKKKRVENISLDEKTVIEFDYDMKLLN